MRTFPLAAVVALIVLGFNEYSSKKSSYNLFQISNRAQLSLKLHQLLTYMVDVETGQRGFLLTGHEAYLMPAKVADEKIEETLKEIQPYFQDNFQAAAVFDALRRMCSKKQAGIRQVIDLYRAGQHDAWHQILMTDIGKMQMDAIRVQVAALLAYEKVELDRQRNVLYQFFTISRLTISFLTVLGLVCLMLFLKQTRSLEQVQLSYAVDLALERDGLEKQVLSRTSELTALAKYLQTVREDEKSNLARELHDELGALLTAAKLDIARLKRSLGTLSSDVQARMDHLAITINEVIGLKRRITEDLHPSSLGNLGLLAALEIQMQEFEERSGLKINAHLQQVIVPEHADIVIYRFVQEALTNIIKHAKATQVEVTLENRRDEVYLAVMDNGVGMAQSQTKKHSAHGLLGMRYRIESLSGRMTVSPSPQGQGLRLEAWLPQDLQRSDLSEAHTDDEAVG